MQATATIIDIKKTRTFNGAIFNICYTMLYIDFQLLCTVLNSTNYDSSRFIIILEKFLHYFTYYGQKCNLIYTL